ncbi:MAG: hypothetical protein WCC60_03700 [Ilumatobacteraceae bacterium]
MTLVLAVVGGLAGLAVVMAVTISSIRRAAAKVTADALGDQAAAGAVIAAPALMGGLHMVGMRRTQGNGVLALHPDRLTFVLGKPRRSVDIALAPITDVELSKVLRMPGRYVRQLRPWLIVRWPTQQGEAIAGFIVAEPQRWAQAIRPNDWCDTTG